MALFLIIGVAGRSYSKLELQWTRELFYDWLMLERNTRGGDVMIQLALLVLFLGLIFYLQENSSERPSFLHAGVFAGAVIEGTLCLAFF